MIISSSSLRGLALLLITFVVGGVAGAAVDRSWLQTKPKEPVTVSPSGFRGQRETVESDRIPLPLERLVLTATEEAKLHEIARRWRPQAERAMADIRANVSDLENNMFAEMLCVLTKEQQDRYLAQLQENNANNVMIDKRFSLVRSNQCESVRRGEERPR
jgi:hypothetical protein